MTAVKICGVTSVEQALDCVDLGANALGVNFVPSSPRRVPLDVARAIAKAVGGRALVVGVVADLSVSRMRALLAETGVGCLQLHGEEAAEDLAAMLPHAYKAIRVENAEDVARAERMPGDYVLVDAKVEGLLGGTGHRLEGALVRSLAKLRRLVLAGGLAPDNVAEAIAQVGPYCVDVASGVESSPGIKDLGKVAQFIAAVRGAGGPSTFTTSG